MCPQKAKEVATTGSKNLTITKSDGSISDNILIRETLTHKGITTIASRLSTRTLELETFCS